MGKKHRCPKGRNYSQWKGAKGGYRSIHKWLRKNKTPSEVCEICGKKKKLDLANIKYKEGYDPSEILGVLEEKQADLFPGLPFNYSFLDDEVENLYRVENKTGRIIRYFTIISIILSCMGILGMALYELELRTREVAIRKVLALMSGRFSG